MVKKGKVSSSVLKAMGLTQKLKAPKTEKINTWRLFVGDTVEVVDGKRAIGERGEILSIDKKKNRVLVKDVNTALRREVGSGGEPGGSFQKAMPLHYSNVALIDPAVNGPVHTCWRYDEAGKLVRISKVTGNAIPAPKPYLKKKEPGQAGPKDTMKNHVDLVTYDPEPITFEGFMKKSQLAVQFAAIGGSNSTAKNPYNTRIKNAKSAVSLEGSRKKRNTMLVNDTEKILWFISY
eukprot:CFRG8619T1